MTSNKKLPKPSTHSFGQWLDEVALPKLAKTHGAHAGKLVAVLGFLERQRYDFSGGRAFQTKPLANAAVAAHFHGSVDSAKRWMRQLEQAGLIQRQYRKNRFHAFKNFFNRIGFSHFKVWFETRLAEARVALCTPNEKTIYDSKISDDENLEERAKKVFRPFPSSGGVKYCTYWEPITDKALAHFPRLKRPSAAKLAESFRKKMKGYNRSLSNPAIETAWINWCKNAFPA